MFIPNTKYKILTPTGFQDFKGIQKTLKRKNLRVYFADGTSLDCSLNHAFIINGQKILAAELKKGYSVAKDKIVKKIERFQGNINLYDPVEVDNGNVYCSSGIISHNCSFLMTGDTFIDSDVLTRLRDNIQEDFYTRYNNRMRVFNEPNEYHDYMLSVDPSLGRGRDYSAFHIIDLYNGEQVVEFYSNKIPLNVLADHVATEAYNYNTAYVICERNGIGRALIDALYYVKQYENIWMDETDFGVQVSNHNREQILGTLEQALREGWFRIRSGRCVDELMTFVIDERTGKIEAGEGSHDDLVLSLAMASYAISKLGSNAPLFATNSIESDDKYQIVSPVVSSAMSKPVHPGSDETVEDYHKWLNK